MKQALSIRYFGRFRGYVGKLRAVVRYGNARKFVKTPFAIDRERLQRLNSRGYFEQPQEADALFLGRLTRFSMSIRAIALPLIGSDTFATTTSEAMSAAVNNAYAATLSNEKHNAEPPIRPTKRV